MKKIIQILIVVLSIAACSSGNTVEIEGDLHFSFLRVGSFYNVHDTIVSKVEAYMDTTKSLDKKTVRIENLYKALKSKNLLYSPFIQLKMNDTTNANLYLDSLDYEQFKAFDLKELIDSNQKVVVKAIAAEIEDNAFTCLKLINVSKTKGQTRNWSRKLKIENYK